MSLAILCPGQGSQHVGMFDLLTGHHAAELVLEQAQAAAAFDLREAVRGGSENMFVNRIAQPLLCAVELATCAALRERLPGPVVFAGYSVGELAAYGCAGALEPVETVRLANRRAALMDDASPTGCGLLAVTGLNRAAIDALCNTHGAYLAIDNGPAHSIVGGTAVALDGVAASAAQAGAATRTLAVSVPAHTPLLGGAVALFADELERSALKAPGVPVLGGIDGSPVRDRARAVATLAAQLAQTVHWSTCLEVAVEMGADVFLELGPGCALARMVRESYPEIPARSVAEFRTLDGVGVWLEKLG